MKCPQCSHDQKRRQTGMTCEKCQYKYVFDPLEDKLAGDKLTDGKFAHALRQASRNETQYFTLNQFKARIEKKRQASHKTSSVILGCISFFLLVVEIILIAVRTEAAFVIGVLCLIVGIIFLVKVVGGPPKVEVGELAEMVRRWEGGGYSVPYLVLKPQLHTPPPESQHEDVYDYGVERIVFMQFDLYVDLFVRNQWHVENKALILSERGYPEYLSARAIELLEAQPELPVMLMHDASPEGVGMRKRMEKAKRFPIEGHPINDLGLFPADVQKMKGLRKRSEGSEHVALDALPFGALAMGAAYAATSGMAFGDILDLPPERAAPTDFG